MPSRWWIPVHGIDPAQVKLPHLHAAVSGWLDPTAADHASINKAYSLSPISHSVGPDGEPEVGFEVGVLSDVAFDRLREHSHPGRRFRLGHQVGRLGSKVLLGAEPWAPLARPSGARGWELEFVTPVTFRTRNRSSPWPAPATVVRGLQESWAGCGGPPITQLSHQQIDNIWVSDLAGRSEVVMISAVPLKGFLGRIEYQCDHPTVADAVDPLFRLAVYSGVGTGKARGLGVTRLVATRRPADRAAGTG